MQIYHYTNEGEYIGGSTAELDPLEGKPLIPGYATTISPPAAQSGKVRIFDGASWSLVTDNRGIWYMPNRTEVKLELIVDVVPIGTTRIIPPLPKRTPTDMWNLISAKRDKLTTTGGYKVNVVGIDKWFHSDTFSRTQQLGLVMMGASIPANLQWKTMDKSFVIMTQALAAQVFVAAAASDQTIFTAAEVHRVAMEASTDPDAYNFLSGWPVVFA